MSKNKKTPTGIDIKRGSVSQGVDEVVSESGREGMREGSSHLTNENEKEKEKNTTKRKFQIN